MCVYDGCVYRNEFVGPADSFVSMKLDWTQWWWWACNVAAGIAIVVVCCRRLSNIRNHKNSPICPIVPPSDCLVRVCAVCLCESVTAFNSSSHWNCHHFISWSSVMYTYNWRAELMIKLLFFRGIYMRATCTADHTHELPLIAHWSRSDTHTMHSEMYIESGSAQCWDGGLAYKIINVLSLPLAVTKRISMYNRIPRITHDSRIPEDEMRTCWQRARLPAAGSKSVCTQMPIERTVIYVGAQSIRVSYFFSLLLNCVIRDPSWLTSTTHSSFGWVCEPLKWCFRSSPPKEVTILYCVYRYHYQYQE